MLKRIVLLLFVLTSHLFLVEAGQYKLKSANHIFYRVDESAKEVRVMPNGIIPGDDVYVRMHADDKDGATFEIEDPNHVIFVCSAPKQWPGRKLKDCILRKKDKSEAISQVTMANAIPMGNSSIKQGNHFHYLFAFVSQFDDPHWSSFPYADKEVEQMQQAIDVVRSQQLYLRGKQYLLSMPRITKRDITCRLDTILQNAREGDFVFLYLSSHGEKDKQGLFHFITKDTYRDSQGGFINSISKSEINSYVNKLTSKKVRVLFFLDACYAGLVMDNSIQGEAAYYVSTNGENASYYNRLFGSPFALSLMEAMTGSINDKFSDIFKDNQVQVGSLGNYLSSNVLDKGEQLQRPLSDEHAFAPSYVLWNIHPNTAKKESIAIRKLAEKAETNPEDMLKLGDRYYKGEGIPVDFYKAFECYEKVVERSKNKEVKAKGLFKISSCFYYGNPEQDDIMAYEYALEAAKLNNPEAMTRVGFCLSNGIGTPKDKSEGVQWFLRAAKRNHADAQYNLGVCYYFGNGVPQNYEKAVEWYTKAAEQGYADAQNNLGVCYACGEGITRSDEKAVEWYTKAAEQGDAYAQINLGKCYYDGIGVLQNYEKAAEWYTKAAKQGKAEAQYRSGNCYYYGEGVPQNYKKAVEWYTKAAEQGYADAQYNLGYCYSKGKGVPQNYEKAVEWYTKAAKQGIASAQINLGVCYYKGNGVPQNYEKAVEWYTKAAEQGDADAQYYLGYCYYYGNGVPQNYEKAVEWYTKAAEQGDADAQNNLGNCYYYGNGVPQNYEKAVEWYTKAAEQGDAFAQNNLGTRHYYGEGVPQNYEKAVEWYFKAAEQGNANAQKNLGKCYYYGNGVPQNYEKAVEWYTKAAEQGNAHAQNSLGNCYYFGNGVPQNYEKAVEWYTKAAEQGNANAQNSLGNCYYIGNGVSQNYEKAVEWYTKAAEQGNAEAQYWLGRCYFYGRGVAFDQEKARELMQKAAEQKDQKAIIFVKKNYGN